MPNTTDPIIVGAGPVGLAAAVFLARQGVFPRIVDRAPGAAPHSKALAVNPRTLEILDTVGVTERMLAIGMRIHGVRISSDGKLIGEMSLAELQHKYPFMLALSQAVTVRLLESALDGFCRHVEWNCELVDCRTDGNGVDVELKSTTNGTTEMLHCPWLLAADGARSAVRHALSIEFVGSSFEKPWYLTDVPLNTSLAEDHAHVFFQGDGRFLFVIRVVDTPDAGRAGDPVWRLVGNFPDLLDRFESGKACGPSIWTSEFHVAHRINERLRQGNVYFAGDAAHVHSPMGARGMNLGIEDAYVFSRLLNQGQLARYADLRYDVDRRVVRRVQFLSKMIGGESAGSRVLRKTVFPAITHFPMMRERFMRIASGLDHPLVTSGNA